MYFHSFSLFIPLTSLARTAPINNLSASDITPSTVFLNWTEPARYSSFYIVGWKNGIETTNAITTKTSFTVTNLTPGEAYTLTVIAFVVAEDNQTAGQDTNVTVYTSKQLYTILYYCIIQLIEYFLLFSNYVKPVYREFGLIT